VKEALARLGICRRMVRPPLAALSDGDAAEVAIVVERWELHSLKRSALSGGNE
jgi:dihydrodipicolinate synthase/N-acetylneuraminate lyase